VSGFDLADWSIGIGGLRFCSCRQARVRTGSSFPGSASVCSTEHRSPRHLSRHRPRAGAAAEMVCDESVSALDVSVQALANRRERTCRCISTSGRSRCFTCCPKSAPPRRSRGLGLAVGTVKVRLVRIYRVLGPHNRVEAIPLPTRDGHLPGTAARRRQATRSPATSWVKTSENARPDSANFFVVQCSQSGIYHPMDQVSVS